MPFLVHGRSGTHLIPWWCLGAYEFIPKQRSIGWVVFLWGWHLWPCNRHIHGPHCMCSSRPHPCYAVWCDLKVTLQHLAWLACLYLRPTSVTHIFMRFLLICSLKGVWSKLFAVSVWSNFDSILKLLSLKITLVVSSNANEVQDIDLGPLWACPNIKDPFLWENPIPT